MKKNVCGIEIKMDSKAQRHIDRAQALVEEFGGVGKKRPRPIKLTKIKIKYTPRIAVAEQIKEKKEPVC